ncbi:MAG: hypothetical protein IPP66_05580 [Anaerolineales bacterium]|nr:hypothetical protein [Anaerolineales bacterium]
MYLFYAGHYSSTSYGQGMLISITWGMQVIGRYSKDYLFMLVALHDLNLAAHYADLIACLCR